MPLLSCPFCGSNNVEPDLCLDRDFTIDCQDCEAVGPWAKKAEIARSKWNNRECCRSLKSDRDSWRRVSEQLECERQTLIAALRPDDAQFIAAGPELAIACMALIEWARHAGDAPQMLDDAVELARAAVEKAGMTNG